MMKPRITKSGNYDPIELVEYLRQAKRIMTMYEISAELKVSHHRVVFFLGEGWNRLLRQAEIAKFVRLGIIHDKQTQRQEAVGQ